MAHRSTGNNAAQMAEPVLVPLERPLRFLLPCHIRAIDDALAAIGPYGEVRLIKHAGKLRFIQKMMSEAFNSNE